MSGLVPKLRFKQDDGSDFPVWSSLKLTNIATIIDGDRGKNYPNGEDFQSDGYCVFLNAKNVTKSGFALKDLMYITQLKDKILSKGKLQRNDLVLTTRGSIGHIAYFDENIPYDNMRINSGMVLIRAEMRKISPLYLYMYASSPNIEKQIQTITFGSAQPQLTVKSIKELSCVIPSLPEQQKIADFLSAVDAKIDAVKRKRDAFERYKKGLMQQIFSQKIRFKQDDGSDFPEWEEKLLGDIGSVYGGLTGKSADDFGAGVPFVTYMQIFKNSFVKMSECAFVKINDWEKQNRVAYGDVLITTSSETPQEVGFTSVILEQPNELYLNSFSFGFRANDNQLLPELSRYLFRSPEYRIKVMLLAQGSTRYNISKSGFLKIALNIPTLPEQKNIADFLSSIDAKIDAITSQIEKLEVFKKGLLQQMFV